MKPNRQSLQILFVCLLAVCTVTRSWSQQITAAINGTVRDPSGSPIANAKVTATDNDRGTVRSTQSNSAGSFDLPTVPIGNYTVRVEQTGFQVQQSTVTLVLNQVAKIDFELKVGSVSTAVEVTSASPILQTESTEVSTVMEAHEIAALPLQTRNYNQLTLLIPGSVTTSPASFNTGQTTFNSGRPYINGNREQASYYLLDGMENTEFVDNNVAFSPNVDAIQEFNVITNNPSAQYGQFLGGVISVSTKSGTNQFHGNLFEFLRNDYFNANEWSSNFSTDPTVSSAPPKLRWNEFGGTFGGPAIKNKLFFFTDYQGSRFDKPATPGTSSTFTNRARTGDLSDTAGLQLHYPGTTVPLPANLNNAVICTGSQKFGSSPCINGISPTALKILGVLPQPNLPGANGGTLNNLGNSVHSYTNGDQGDAKVDWVPTGKDHIFGRYSQQFISNPTTNSQPLIYGTTNNFPLYSGVLDFTHVFSSRVINDLRAGVSYYPADANTVSGGSSSTAGLINGQPTPYLPALTFSGSPVGTAFGTADAPEIFHQTTIQLDDTVVLSRGSHTIHAGFQFLRYRNDYVPATSNDGAAGTIGFTGNYTGNPEADFLLGLPTTIAYGKGYAGTVGQRNSAIGAFVQDDWRVTPHLTINVGLRYQVFTPIYEVGNRMTNFGAYSGQIQLAGVNGNSRALYNQYNGIANFLPRIGAAWTPWDDKTVIRAAFSRSSFQEGTGEYNRLATNAPWNIDLTGQYSAGTNGAIPSNQLFLDQGFAGLGSGSSGVPCTPQTVTSAPASCFAGIRIHMTDPNYRPAVSNQWNLALQHQFGNALTIQASYIGQHTDHLAAIYFAGQSVLNADGTVSPGPYLAGNPALKNAGTGQVRLNTSTGIQNYNALQLSAQQRFSRGLSYQLNYTWSKCLTNNQGYYGRYGDAGASQASADVSFQQYVYNTSLDYGLCDHDVTNVFNGYLSYELPFGRNRMFGSNSNKTVNAILGDWQMNTIFTVHGGFPISMLDWSGDAGTGSAQGRPDCIAPAKQTPYQNYAGGGYVWFDASTMRDPAPGKLGNCGISSERGPGIKQVDVGLSKKFRITERQNVEFRAEAINFFNSPIFTVQGYQIDVFSNGGSLMPVSTGSSNLVPNPSSLTGVVNSSQGARNLQFGLKYTF
ncbi:MAG: TonB-dependent receptor [Bryobacterales bacterium]|nr:TonB-dependent receptor [Bryobacterales bacterium]